MFWKYLNMIGNNLNNMHLVCCRFKSVDISTPLFQRYLNYLVLQTEVLLSKDKRDWSDIVRLRELRPISNIFTQKMFLEANIQSLNQQYQQEADEDDKNVIRKEVQIYQMRMKEIDSQIKTTILEPYLPEGEILLQLDVTEGDHAAVFVKELVDMYKAYANYKLWDHNIVSLENNGMGFLKASLFISGSGVTKLMSIEDGVHLQITELSQLKSDGQTLPKRINMATVSVLPVPTKSEYDICSENFSVEVSEIEDTENKDLKCSSTRVIHIPSKTLVECNISKSVNLNTENAIKKLKTILFHTEKEKLPLKESKPFRTYDVVRDRVMEHREGDDTQYKLTTFMRGGQQLESLQTSVLRHWHYQSLMEDLRKFQEKFPVKEEMV